MEITLQKVFASWMQDNFSMHTQNEHLVAYSFGGIFFNRVPILAAAVSPLYILAV
jgi:hypothetical protein